MRKAVASKTTVYTNSTTTAHSLIKNMVSDERIELPCSACKTDVFPLDQSELVPALFYSGATGKPPYTIFVSAHVLCLRRREFENCDPNGINIPYE